MVPRWWYTSCKEAHDQLLDELKAAQDDAAAAERRRRAAEDDLREARDDLRTAQGNARRPRQPSFPPGRRPGPYGPTEEEGWEQMVHQQVQNALNRIAGEHGVGEREALQPQQQQAAPWHQAWPNAWQQVCASLYTTLYTLCIQLCTAVGV